MCMAAGVFPGPCEPVLDFTGRFKIYIEGDWQPRGGALLTIRPLILDIGRAPMGITGFPVTPFQAGQHTEACEGKGHVPPMQPGELRSSILGGQIAH